MQDLVDALERLQLCESLSKSHRDLIECCLDEGYETLSLDDKSTIRRLLNQQAAGHTGALKRWRERKRMAQAQQQAASAPPKTKSSTTRRSARTEH